ncbi:MAG: hypothetical protein RLZZ546_2246 [Bacteroidota bacterium]|jgi:hypothetical protein
MKQTFLILLSTAFFACKQNSENEIKKDTMLSNSIDKISVEKEVLETIHNMDLAYKANQDSLFRTFLSKDIIVYGTDPSEVWPYDVFKNHIPETQSRNLPKLGKIKTNFTHINADGNTACVVRELNWKGVFDNTIRQNILVEKEDGKWMIKMITLAHLLPNKTGK